MELNNKTDYKRLNMDKLNFSDETISYEDAVHSIPLKDRVVIIEDKNIARLLALYEHIKDVGELTKIVNRHLEVAIDEIEEDNRRQRNIMAMAKLDRDNPYRKETDFDAES